MSKKKSKHWGHQTYRFKENPEEQRFANAWRDENERGSSDIALLDLLLGDGGSPVLKVADARDCMVAATVIQWLGSPVGQSFLADLGYGKIEDTKKKDEKIAELTKIAIEGWTQARSLVIQARHVLKVLRKT